MMSMNKKHKKHKKHKKKTFKQTREKKFFYITTFAKSKIMMFKLSWSFENKSAIRKQKFWWVKRKHNYMQLNFETVKTQSQIPQSIISKAQIAQSKFQKLIKQNYAIAFWIICTKRNLYVEFWKCSELWLGPT